MHRSRSIKCRLLNLFVLLVSLFTITYLFHLYWYSRRTTIKASRSSNIVPTITMMVTVVQPSVLSSHTLALSTLRCYAGIHHYPLYYHFYDYNGTSVINARFPDGASYSLNGDWDATDALRQCKCNASIENEPDAYTAMLFFRHCLALRYLVEHDNGIGNSWVLSLDADIGVVNPRHRIEEWIDTNVDLIFYERDWTWEAMAGSYLVKNTPQSHAFLSRWIYHQNELIAAGRPMRNYDQGALQTMLMRWFATPSEQAICARYHDKAANFPLYFVFVACCRHFIYQHAAAGSSKSAGVFYFNHAGSGLRIKLLQRWHPAWSRDASGRGSIKWSRSWDFMLHDWKDTYAGALYIAPAFCFFRQRRPTPTFPNPDFKPVDPPSEWEAPFNDSILTQISPSLLESECIPAKRETIMQLYWFDRWRRDLMLDGHKMKDEFDKVDERVNKEFAVFCKSANLSDTCASTINDPEIFVEN